MRATENKMPRGHEDQSIAGDARIRVIRRFRRKNSITRQTISASTRGKQFGRKIKKCIYVRVIQLDVCVNNDARIDIIFREIIFVKNSRFIDNIKRE